MKIVIADGAPESGAFADRIDGLARAATDRGHEVVHFVLREMNVKDCAGCFRCWFRTPGQCNIADDCVRVAREYVNSNLAIFASPLIMGFTSALLKRLQDRLTLIPMLPYFHVRGGKVSHPKRYPKLPEMGVVTAREEDTDQEDIDALTQVYERMAHQHTTRLHFIRFAEDPQSEVLDEIDGVQRLAARPGPA